MSLASGVGKFLIRLYQAAISPLMGGGKCRFYPVCSEYAIEAIEKYGLLYGSILGLRRLVRCGPWTSGGYDPVPGPEVFETWILLGRFFNKTSKG